jgi:hypothetical protein
VGGVPRVGVAIDFALSLGRRDGARAVDVVPLWSVR